MGLTTKEISSSSFNDMISSIDRRSEFVENRAGANVTTNNALISYGLSNSCSILNAPCGYSNGVLNSVKPAKTFGSDLSGGVDNYDNLYGSTTVTDGSANVLSTGALSGLGWSNILTVGRKYKFSYNVTDSTSGQIKITGGSSDIVLDSTVGSHSIEFTSSYVYFNILRVASCDITINNISLQLITEADFDFTRGSSSTRINEQGLVQDVQLLSGELVQNGDFEQIGSELVPSIATIVNAGGGSITQISGNSYSSTSDGTSVSTVRPKFDFATTSGKIYKLVITPIGTVTGTVNFDFYDGSTYLFQNYDFTTTKEVYFTDNGNVFGAFDGTQTYSISNFKVSVKEVGQNWTFGGAWDIENGKALYDGSFNGSLIQQNFILTSGKKYKASFNVLDNSGRFRITVDGGNSVYQTYTTGNGYYTFEFTSASTNFRIGGSMGDSADTFSIDNVSVVEITDDTDLPRINYTNFDYEDVLGDELVTNGTFDTDSNWSYDNVGGTKGWRIADNRAICDVSGVSNGRNLQQNLDISITSGKKYKISLDILQSDDNISLLIGGQTVTLPTGTNLGYETTFVASSTSTLITFFAGTSDTQEIDNVSVKELTEDVVVPYSGEGSLLLEPQSTNLVTYSEDFTQWATSGIITIESGYLAPDGSTNAYKITDNAPSNNATALFLVGVAAASNSRTIWAKTVSGTGTANLCSHNSNTNNLFTVTNKWQRFEVNGTTSTSGNSNFYGIDFRNSGTLDEIIIWGAQSEALSYATSYIPTNGSTVTRLADVCNNSGNSDLINSTEGVLYAEISALADDLTNREITISDGTSNNRIEIRYTTTSDRLQGIVRSNGAVVMSKFTSNYDITNYNKIAVKFRQNDFSLYINGNKIGFVTSGNTPTGLNKLQFDAGAGSLPFYGNVKCVAVFKEALSDTELQKLTTI